MSNVSDFFECTSCAATVVTGGAVDSGEAVVFHVGDGGIFILREGDFEAGRRKSYPVAGTLESGVGPVPITVMPTGDPKRVRDRRLTTFPDHTGITSQAHFTASTARTARMVEPNWLAH